MEMQKGSKAILEIENVKGCESCPLYQHIVGYKRNLYDELENAWICRLLDREICPSMSWHKEKDCPLKFIEEMT